MTDHPITPDRRSKLARLEAHVQTIQAGRIHLPAGAPFVEAFLEEFCVTPRKYFDQIDATVQMLDWIPDKVLRPAQPRIIGLRTNYNGIALGRGRRVPRVIGGKWRI